MRRGAIGLIVLAAMVGAHELLARALDAAELIERLLALGPDALLAIPAAVLLYALRLALMFAGPGVALLCVLAIAWDARARWSSPRERRP